MDALEERLALFLDFENLAIGAREDLSGHVFEFGPIADALAERGRVVVRRAYADWVMFEEARRMLTEHQVELIEIPQRIGASRKNAADIKMAVDAVELSFERDYITTFVLGTGDSDFTPLVHKLRELNRRVIGIGLRGSTSPLLAAACDEFLYYESLPGLDLPQRREKPRPRRDKTEEPAPPAVEPPDLADLERMVTQTLSGLQQSADGVVLASSLKRALLRKDPTFTEADYGFRAFGELLRHLADHRIIELNEGPARGDPEVAFPSEGGPEELAFALLRQVVTKAGRGKPVPLSGLKDRMRKTETGFTEKAFGYRGFLQFCRAAAAREVVTMDWDEAAEDYLLAAV
jgi:uncharacterized LabA/DUF88 family protein